MTKPLTMSGSDEQRMRDAVLMARSQDKGEFSHLGWCAKLLQEIDALRASQAAAVKAVVEAAAGFNVTREEADELFAAIERSEPYRRESAFRAPWVDVIERALNAILAKRPRAPQPVTWTYELSGKVYDEYMQNEGGDQYRCLYEAGLKVFGATAPTVPAQRLPCVKRISRIISGLSEDKWSRLRGVARDFWDEAAKRAIAELAPTVPAPEECEPDQCDCCANPMDGHVCSTSDVCLDCWNRVNRELAEARAALEAAEHNLSVASEVVAAWRGAVERPMGEDSNPAEHTPQWAEDAILELRGELAEAERERDTLTRTVHENAEKDTAAINELQTRLQELRERSQWALNQLVQTSWAKANSETAEGLQHARVVEAMRLLREGLTGCSVARDALYDQATRLQHMFEGMALAQTFIHWPRTHIDLANALEERFGRPRPGDWKAVAHTAITFIVRVIDETKWIFLREGDQPAKGKRLTPEREAYLRSKPAHYHVHELWPELDALRAELASAEARATAAEANSDEFAENARRQHIRRLEAYEALQRETSQRLDLQARHAALVTGMNKLFRKWFEGRVVVGRMMAEAIQMLDDDAEPAAEPNANSFGNTGADFFAQQEMLSAKAEEPSREPARPQATAALQADVLDAIKGALQKHGLL